MAIRAAKSATFSVTERVGRGRGSPTSRVLDTSLD